MWVVKFKADMQSEPIRIYADDVDLMSPPFIYVRGIRTKYQSDIIEIPESEEYQELVCCNPLIISSYQIVYMGEIGEEEKQALGLVKGGICNS